MRNIVTGLLSTLISTVGWSETREKRAKEQYYLGEIKRVMREAREAGLLVSK
jgi:hypothetical protein